MTPEEKNHIVAMWNNYLNKEAKEMAVWQHFKIELAVAGKRR